MSVKAWVRVLYYPLILVGALALHYALLDYVSEKMLPLLSAMMSLIFITIIFVSERIIPYEPDWNRDKGDSKSDFLLTMIVLPLLVQVADLVLKLSLFPVSLWLQAQWGYSFWPKHWPVFGQLALALVVAELFFYWIHWATHKFDFLWRFHRLHHVSRRVYWMNSGRFHPIDGFLSFFFYLLPLIFLGVPADVMSLFFTVTLVLGLMEHANVDFEAGPLNYVFNTAQLHRWHHGRQCQWNYGKILIIWDILFRSFHYPTGKRVTEVGVD